MFFHLQIVAATGKLIQKNGFCILSQNIVNEKVFLVLYWWYFALFFVALFYFLYRACTILVPSLRERITLLDVRGDNAAWTGAAVRKVLRQCSVGDWFVLNQVRSAIIAITRCIT